MTDTELDILDADLRRRAESLWSALVGDAELFAQLREVLAELRADARRHGGSGLPALSATTELSWAATIALPSSDAAVAPASSPMQAARSMHAAD